MKRQILLGLFLLTILCAASVFAQEKTSVSESQCEMAVKEDFVGEKINLRVVNTDIRDILTYIAEQYGCNFALEDKVGKITVTTTIENLSWNTALKTILKSHNLDMMAKIAFPGRKIILFVGTERKIYCESSGMCCNGVYISEKDTESVYSEFIKLKNLPICPNNIKCEQTSLALNNLKTYVSRRLTKKGQIEIDESSQTLIITDVRENLNALIALIKLLDNEAFYNEVEKDK